MQTMHHQFDAIPLPMPGEPAAVPCNTQPAAQHNTAVENNLLQGYNQHQQHQPPNASVNNSNNASLPTGAGPTAMAAAADGAYRAASVINLSNSNDIVIGPMTQYQGAVTIYQYMDATVETTSNRPPGGLGLRGNNNGRREAAGETNKVCNIFNLQNLQTWALIIVLISIATGVGVAIYLALQKVVVPVVGEPPRPPREILFGNEYEDETIPNLGNGHLVIDRKQWGAASIVGTANLTLRHPIPHVIITHVGVQSKPCDNVYNCSIKMRTIQDSAIAEKKIPDIPANFYVSQDGYVYVGRGWNIQNVYADKSLAICFMGDYVRYEPSDKQLDAVRYLLTYGVTRDLIQRDYQLIAHNQTKSTKSPGSNVYEEIKKWSHWYSCGVDGQPKCDW